MQCKSQQRLVYSYFHTIVMGEGVAHTSSCLFSFIGTLETDTRVLQSLLPDHELKLLPEPPTLCNGVTVVFVSLLVMLNLGLLLFVIGFSISPVDTTFQFISPLSLWL